MEELKTLFGEGSLSYDEFSQKLNEAGETIKLANLKTGGYVDKSKYDKLEKGLEDYKTKYAELEANTKGYEELKGQFEDISSKYNELLGKQELADKMSLISDSNVDKDFAEFVYSKVNAMTNDKKDFQTALDEYLKEHKQYIKGAMTKGTYVNLENGSTPPKSANEKFNENLRKIRGNNTL